MSEEPKVVEKNPLVEVVGPGEYWWCACGRSSDQPYCDRSHEGTGIAPVQITIDGKKQVTWCQCKHTKTPPWCDGTHTKLP